MAARYFQLAASGNVDLGDSGLEVVSVWTIQLKGTGFTGSVQPQARVKPAPAGQGAPTYANIAYTDRADGTTKTTAISGDALVEVNGAGVEIRLAVTVSAGSVEIWAHPAHG